MAAGYGKGWIDGSCIRSGPFTNVSQSQWDKIFGKDKKRSAEKHSTISANTQGHCALGKPR